MPNVYHGRKSCYARREGRYVKRISGTGIDTLSEASAIAYLILRDYRRGWTYDRDSCRKIPMTEKLFRARLRGLVRYSSIHLDRLVREQVIQESTARTIKSRIKSLARYVERYKRMPRRMLVRARRALNRV